MGAAGLFSYGLTNFDKRKLLRLHGDLAYDKFEDIFLDDYAFKRQADVEITQAKKFYSELDKSEVFYDIREELQQRGVSNPNEPPEVLGEYEYKNILRVAGTDSYYALYRRKIGTDFDQVIFDPLKDHAFPKKYLNSHTIQSFSLDDGHERLGISIDVKSNELPTGYIRDLKNSKLLGDR